VSKKLLTSIILKNRL